MLLLYRCLQICGDVLFATSGSRLDSFSLEDGSRRCSWTCPAEFDETIDTTNVGIDGHDGNENSPPTPEHHPSNDIGSSEPRAKRRRLSKIDNPPKDSNKESTSQNKHHDRARLQAPAFVALTCTARGRHVIAVTGEDKSIRVFEHDGEGRLRHISQRAMPKRPSAIAITTDESTIICADKFGDVYSLPLLIPVPQKGQQGQSASPKTTIFTPVPSKPFAPAANDLTVHSVRNRKALQNQRRQGQSIFEKEEPGFERNLLFGHVSMLTDIAWIERNGLGYIITADRDEHIRISRGMPQSHIIEGYCLGHTDFVSQLCSPTRHPELLISGGGDDEIYVWDWLNGKLLDRMNLRRLAEAAMLDPSQSPGTTPEAKGKGCGEQLRVAVSGICHLQGSSDMMGDLIIVICEGMPAIFTFSLLDSSRLAHYRTLKIDGNPLRVAAGVARKVVVVSVDTVHEPGSTSKPRACGNRIVDPLQIFGVTNTELVGKSLKFHTGSHTGEDATTDKGGILKNMSNLLYSLENLRKRGNWD